MAARWAPIWAALCLSALLLAAVTATPEAIPNADRVPNPCQHNTTWPGVGYRDVAGRGRERNPFGVDLDKHNKVWTAALCHLDSDLDGMSNGQELGDPSCTWTPNSPRPDSGLALYHPGICEPLTNEDCKRRNAWLTCENFTCPAFSLHNTQQKPLQVPRTSVPAGPDTYYCIALALPTDAAYHIIGSTPLLTSHVAHDVVLYGCDSNFNGRTDQLIPC
jgi:dopamine beta-monooxygenase